MQNFGSFFKVVRDVLKTSLRDHTFLKLKLSTTDICLFPSADDTTQNILTYAKIFLILSKCYILPL